MKSEDFYVFLFDGITWSISDTIWQTHKDAYESAKYLFDNNKIYKKVCVASSKDGSFPYAYLTLIP